jgi:hypothetical protein
MAWPIIAAVAGAAIGGLSSLMSGSKQAAAYAEQKRIAWEQYLANKEFADTQWGVNKGEALKSLGIQQGRLNEDVNAGVENFNLGLLGQAYGMQDARIGLASQMGAYDAAQGASGARGNEANGLVKAYAQNSFDRSAALQGEQNDQGLAGMMTQAARGSQDISRERDSWGAGGYRTQLYEAEDERNRKLAELGQQQLQYQADASAPGVFDFLTGGIMGANTGLNFASNVQEAQRYSNQPSYLNTNYSFSSIGGGAQQYTSGLGVTYGGNPYARPW